VKWVGKSTTLGCGVCVELTAHRRLVPPKPVWTMKRVHNAKKGQQIRRDN